MTSAGSVYLCLSVLLGALALSGYGASAKAFTGPWHPGTPTAGEHLQIASFPDLTRSVASDSSNATFAVHEPAAAAPRRSPWVSDSSAVPWGLDCSRQQDTAPTINVSFADAQPNPARAFTRFYQNELQKKFIGGKPCGRLHTN
jgi:hypothetical protein